jgi:hypothetical protein
MHQVLPASHNGIPITYCILDVRQANLISMKGFPNHILETLIAETAYIKAVWN